MSYDGLKERVGKVAKKMLASTRSAIGIMSKDGSIVCIYCHFDSYANEGILKRSYASPALAKALVNGGDIRQLVPDLSALEREGNSPKRYSNYRSWMSQESQDYNLLFINGRWYEVSNGLPQTGESFKETPRYSHRYEGKEALALVLGVPSTARQHLEEFLTFSEGTSNKFHYFGVFEDPDTHEFVGGNAYGRIGGPPKGMEIARGPNLNAVISAVQSKISAKRNKGYQRFD